MAEQKERMFLEFTDKGTVKKHAKHLRGAEKDTKSLIKSAGALALAYVGTRGVVNALKFTIKSASDAQETISKFEAVFKDQAGAAKTFASELATSTNRAEIQLIDFLASLQDTFVPLGFARDKASELSQGLVTLAVDVASFSNKLEADVVRDFQSALVGNTETVRKYGIVITQARLDQELLNMGIEGGKNTATEAEKALARYNLILDGTTDAQGDAIRTAGSFANQMKGLDAAVLDLATNFGEGLLPVLTEGVGVLSDLARGVSAVINQEDGMGAWVAVLIALNPFLANLIIKEKELDAVILTGAEERDRMLQAFKDSGLSASEFASSVRDAAEAAIPLTGVISEQDDELEDLVVTWGENKIAVKDMDAANQAFLKAFKDITDESRIQKDAIRALDDATWAARNAMFAYAGFLTGGAADSFNKFIQIADTLATTLELVKTLQAVTSAGGFIGGAFKFVKGIFGFADGTSSAPGGLSLIGEEGPELMNIPRGAQIIPNNRSMDIINNSGGNTINVSLTVQALSFDNTVMDEIEPRLIAMIERGQSQLTMA